jgi:4'-phosphopantetheinyl transferase
VAEPTNVPSEAVDSAELWYVRPENASSATLEKWNALAYDNVGALRPPERAVARGFARSVLARVVGVPPHDLSVVTDEWGRPRVVAPARATGLSFSLSHTRGLIACLAAWDRRVGADAEQVRHDDSLLEIADQRFAAREAEALRALPQSARHERFLKYWTLKEAYMKARGLGLAISLDAVAFDLAEADGESITASFAGDLADDPANWQFGLHAISREHVVATAVERRSRASATVVASEWQSPPTSGD